LRAGKDVERGQRRGFVDRDSVRQRCQHARDDGNGRGAAPWARTGAIVTSPVIHRGGMIHVVIVRRDASGARSGTVRRDGHRSAAMRRTLHDPLRLAQKEREPDRERE
jgi:hypothetical protein